MNQNTKRTLLRISAVILYIFLIVILYNLGRGHTIYIFNCYPL